MTFLRWAHQGGAREGPSNTLAAMERAVNGPPKSNALECDVHLTRDKHLVVIHDKTLERTTDGSGKVKQYTLDELRKRNAAHWWVKGEVDNHSAPDSAYVHREDGKSDPEYGIPTLQEVLDRFPDVPMTIEIKPWTAARPLVKALADAGRADVTVTSFKPWSDWLARHQLRKHPGYQLGFSPGVTGIAWFRLRVALRIPPPKSRYTRLQIPIRMFGISFANKRVIDAAHKAGMKVDVWTLDEPGPMRSVIALGVDGTMTDSPSVLAAVVNETT